MVDLYKLSLYGSRKNTLHFLFDSYIADHCILAGVRFNPAVKSDVYSELIEKACILLRI